MRWTKEGLASWKSDSFTFHRKAADFLVFWTQIKVTFVYPCPLGLLGDTQSGNLCLLRLQPCLLTCPVATTITAQGHPPGPACRESLSVPTLDPEDQPHLPPVMTGSQHLAAFHQTPPHLPRTASGLFPGKGRVSASPGKHLGTIPESI